MKTLLALLKEKTIKIPTYQRDYAQGRVNDPRAETVRKNLINDIKNVVENDNAEILDLNFVYGICSQDGQCFTPVDGQQRLTTLFLLHLYAFDTEEYNSYFFDTTGCRFSYEARDTSRDFFYKIAQERFKIFNTNQIPSSYIINTKWFLYSWQFDPSISSALVVLDLIQKTQIDKAKLRHTFEETQNPRLFFNYEQISSSDNEKATEQITHDLYLKLNARGRPLTDFEIFKSKFLEFCPKDLKKELSQKLDGQYADYFWRIVKNDITPEKFNTDKFDIAYINFFKYFFQIPIWGVKSKNDENKLESSNAWIYSLEYEKIKPTYRTIMTVLDYITGPTPLPLAVQCVENIVLTSPTFPQRALFCALCIYFDKNDSLVSLADWLRVNNNLIRNSKIEEEKDYEPACDAIRTLSEHKINILEKLQHIKQVENPIDKEQWKEECIKAYFMLQDKKIKNIILQVEEEISYLGGQIRCLLKHSDNYKQEGSLNCDKFVQGAKRLRELLMSEKDELKNAEQLSRALLGYGDYSLVIGKYITLCVVGPYDPQHTPTFKQLFSEYGNEIKELLSTEESLQNLVFKAQQQVTAQNDWRYCFINYPKLFSTETFKKRKMLKNGIDRLLLTNYKSGNRDTSLYLKTLKLMCEEKTSLELQFVPYDPDGNGKKNMCLQMGAENMDCFIKIEFKEDHFQIIDIKRDKKYSISGQTLLTDCMELLKKISVNPFAGN